MTFENILQIITSPKLRKILDDESRTTYQRAADLHAALTEGESSDTPRKPRTIKPRPETEAGNSDGEAA